MATALCALSIGVMDSIAYACARVFVAALANEVAVQTGHAADFDMSLAEMSWAAYARVNSTLGRFLKIKPVKGFSGCGSDLYLCVTDKRTGSTLCLGPNKPLLSGASENERLQFKTLVTYEFEPPIGLSSIPVVCQIPVLGRPVIIQEVGFSPVLYPEGLKGSGVPQTASGDSKERLKESSQPVSVRAEQGTDGLTHLKKKATTVAILPVDEIPYSGELSLNYDWDAYHEFIQVGTILEHRNKWRRIHWTADMEEARSKALLENQPILVFLLIGFKDQKGATDC